MIAIGLMSGTSLDGIDAVRVALHPRERGYAVETLAFQTLAFEPALRARILAAYPPAALGALALSALHADLGDAFAAAALAVGAAGADFIASHGLTIAHDGDAHRTLQIGDAFRIREATGRTVFYDFRSADTAAGGHGAPLVPYADALLLSDERESRAVLNLGGIANVTLLMPGSTPADVIAFDCGPANLPIDTYVEARTGGAQRFDRDGALARAGVADEALLAAWLCDPYFARVPPKSTGREQFGAPFVARYRAALDALPFEDAVRTLTELTIRSVARAIGTYSPGVVRAIVSGGGAHNAVLLEGLRAKLPGTVETSAAHGIDPDAKEAIAFALLGYETLRERPAGLPHVTGAGGPRVLGAIAPAGLAALIERARGKKPEMSDVIAAGIDAGGTSTRVVISENGVAAGEADGPGANATTLGTDDAADAILCVLRKGLGRRKPAAIVIGAAGAGRPVVADALAGLIGSAYPDARVSVEDDTAIALRAAIPAGPGIVLIAGTGSVAYAENGAARARVGGLGYLAGDEGSAFSIGMAAVRLYGRVLDGRAPADETTELVARTLDAPNREAYLAALYDAPLKPAHIAALAPSIIAFGGKGNRAALKIVQQAGLGLGDLLKSASKATGQLESSPSIALAGGLFAENSMLTFLLETRIIGDMPGALVVKGGDAAVIGALRRAEALAAS